MVSLLDIFICPAHTSIKKSLSSVVYARVSESYRGGNKIACVAPRRTALPLDRLWNWLLTSSNNTQTLSNMGVEPGTDFQESVSSNWRLPIQNSGHNESHEIATKIAYQNGALRGTPKGKGESAEKSPMRRYCQRVMLPSRER
jgi:hypothetical protein